MAGTLNPVPASEDVTSTRISPEQDMESLVAFHEGLLTWYAKSRRDLPWRGTPDPYRVLVAEFMLQQTQVSRVAPVFDRFIALFPTMAMLANAPVADVIRAWTGMGYNRRAVNLHRAATMIVSQHGGIIPSDPELLLALPGIGRYTATAVACFGFGRPVAVVDTNVRRVLGRVAVGLAPISPSRAWLLAEQSLPLAVSATPDWNQALMDLGASICAPRIPRCGECPVRTVCVSAPGVEAADDARAVTMIAERRPAQKYIGSSRYYRGRIVEILRTASGPVPLPQLTNLIFARANQRGDEGPAQEVQACRLVEGLQKDGLVRQDDDGVSLP
jgi:A/G-specific adenine glycosylase